MKMTLTSTVQIWLGENAREIVLSLEEARELRDKLDSLLGSPPRAPSLFDALSRYNKPYEPIPTTGTPYPGCPLIYCDATGVTPKTPTTGFQDLINAQVLRD